MLKRGVNSVKITYSVKTLKAPLAAISRGECCEHLCGVEVHYPTGCPNATGVSPWFGVYLLTLLKEGKYSRGR